MKPQRYILLTAIAVLIFCTAKSQSRHEFSIHGGGGLSTLKYNMSTGKFNNGFGGLFGFGYSYFFSENFGVHSGIEASLYNSKATISNLYDTDLLTDKDGEIFEFRCNLSNYEEKQNAYRLNIPLMFQFQTGGQNRFYGLLGAKVSIPLSGKYNSTGTFHNTGYYEYEDFEYDDMTFLGFGTFPNRKEKGSFSMKPSLLASVEAGMKWTLDRGLYLYTGLYFDYGLSNVVKNEPAQKFIVFNTKKPTEFYNNSVLTSQYNSNQAKNFTEKVIPMAIGFKLRLAFGSGADSPTEKEPVYSIVETVPVETPEIEEDLRSAEEAGYQRAKDEESALQREEEEIKRKDDEEFARVIPLIQEPIANFPMNVSTLNEEHYIILDRKAQLLKEFPRARMLICEGHGCEVGNDFVNQVIGLKRADAAKQYLMQKGVEEERIYTLTKGKTEHIVPNDSEANRRRNRRVEFKVLE